MSNLSKLEIVRESDFLEFYPYEDITFPGLIVR